MKIRQILLTIALVTLTVVAHARTLVVNVAYGGSGSHGQYLCRLYKGGYYYTSKWVTNTGFTTGTAVFDVPTGDTYSAAVYCVTDGRLRISNGRYYSWWYTRLDLYVSF